MPATASDFATMRFSTSVLPKRDRMPMLREAIGPMVARLKIAPASPQPHFSVTARTMPGLVVTTMTFSAVQVERTRELTHDGNDDCLLSCLGSSTHRVVHRGREVVPSAGTATLLSMSDPFARAFSDNSRAVTIRVPRKALLATVPGLEDYFGRVVVQDSEALRLLTRYVELLDQNSQLMSGGLRRLVVTHVHDLMALTLGASRDASELAGGRGLRAARLHAIKSDIMNSLSEPDLSLTQIASRHRVTPRYVQALFEQEGVSFSGFLLDGRLAHVHRLLRDPMQSTKPISSIVYEAGFGDLSHFNRAFRRRYGATPSDVRAQATREMDA
jgi:AraC-like DNA-binding protein